MEDRHPRENALRELEEIRFLIEEDFQAHLNGSVTRPDRMLILSHHRQLSHALRQLMEVAEKGEFTSESIPILRALVWSNCPDLWKGLCQPVMNHAHVIRETAIIKNMLDKIVQPVN